MEAEVGGAAEGKVVAEGEVAEEAAAEVAEVRPPPPPVPGLVSSTVLFVRWHRAVDSSMPGHSLQGLGIDTDGGIDAIGSDS